MSIKEGVTMYKNKKRGFTLTELLITLAIIAVLLAIAIPVVSGLLNKGTDTSEDVNAALYTSIMNKFAVEDVQAASSYPRLTTTGTDAEYTTFADKAGNGTFPGYNIIATNSNADVLDDIRREAVIAIKAFSDAAVSDDYYIAPPADADYEYVYYYLTGEVKKMKRDDMSVTSGTNLLNGNINIDEYWVYLSRDGGSGAALGGVTNGTGYLFVQVLQYGTGLPLDGATVTVTSGASTYTAVTEAGQNGYVGFAGILIGSVNVSIERHGAIPFPDSRYYSKSGEIIISDGGYEGCQLNLPYVVDLKLGTLGSLGFYDERVVWENGTWVERREKIIDSVTVTSVFVANTSNPGGSPRNETYTSNLYSTCGVQELLTGDKYLTYGNYNLTVTSYGYRTYREAVSADVYGIDNAVGAYSGFTSPYEYPILMKYPAGQSVISGTVERESAKQPTQGTISGLAGTWGYTDNRYVYARVKLTHQSSGNVYYSSYFQYDAEGKHDYSISGLPDGTYTFDIESPYNYDDLSEFPDTVTIDGRHVEVSGKVYREDVGTGAIKGKITYDSSGNYDPIPGATVRFKRYGDTSYCASTTTDLNGNYSVSNLDCGYYQMTVKLSVGLGGTTTHYKMFISSEESCTVRLSIPKVKISGSVIPYRGSTAVSLSGTLGDLEIRFTRINQAGTKKYSSQSASVTTDGVQAEYNISMVPGYYTVSVTSTCFEDYKSGNALYASNSTRNYTLFIDQDDPSNHYDLTFNYDAFRHWYECENCGEIFDYSDHTPSGWTYYSTTYCYKHCTVCDFVTDGPSVHTMSSYVSKAATCTTTGTRVYYCTKGCGYSYSTTITNGGHVSNGIWVYDENGSESSVGTHHQNCKNCGVELNSGTACTRSGTLYSNGLSNHYDVCSVCSGRRYFSHNWVETSRTGYPCTGGTVYYKCSDCGATKTGTYEATSAHNMRARCDTLHACSWTTYCTAKGEHQWDGYYHVMCTMCQAVDDYKWCAMHMGSPSVVWECPY